MLNSCLLYRAFIFRIVGLFFLTFTVWSRSINRRDLNIGLLDVVPTELEQVKYQTEIFQKSRVVDQDSSVTKPSEFPNQNCHCKRLARRGKDKILACFLCGAPVPEATDIKSPSDALENFKLSKSMQFGSARSTWFPFLGSSLASPRMSVKSGAPVPKTIGQFEKEMQRNGRKALSLMAARQIDVEFQRQQTRTARTAALLRASKSRSLEGLSPTGQPLWPFTKYDKNM